MDREGELSFKRNREKKSEREDVLDERKKRVEKLERE